MSFDSERHRLATGDTGEMRTAMRLAREAGDSAAPQASPLQILAKALAMIAMGDGGDPLPGSRCAEIATTAIEMAGGAEALRALIDGGKA